MKERTTQLLLAAVVAVLLAHLLRPASALPTAHAQGVEQVPAVLRARAIELVNKRGRVVAQLHLGEDGSGQLRLRHADGTVRVKLGANAEGAGLLLCDEEVEPAIQLAVDASGTRLVLSEKGKEGRVLEP